MSFNLKTTGVFSLEAPIHKFDHPAIQRAVLANPAAASALMHETAVTFVCRDKLKNYKNDDWEKGNIMYHTIIVPYDEVMAMNAGEITNLCAELTVQRLLEWAEKKRNKEVKKRLKVV
jgi:hypothetical protein